MKPCNFCIEETCGGGKNMHKCDCATCDKIKTCPRILRPTIRITRKCTQSCSHCLYSCSPECLEMMSVSMAKKTSQFLEANEIMMITIMGGEFICNPDWKEIIPILCENVEYCRLVTNGDWAAKDPMATLDVLRPFKDVIKVSITKDRWHTNKHVNAAIEACKAAGFTYNVTDPKEDNEENIIPVGKGQYHYGMFAMFSCFCHSPEHTYTFLIDEEGDIFKCSPGVWNYTSVDECLTGGFAEKFKEFNQNFYKAYVSNCTSCARAWDGKTWRNDHETK